MVDDSATARKIIRSFLYQAGFYNVREAANGEQALAALKAQPFDLVISDWEMGPIDGEELLRMMRASREYRYTPFIMVTASAHKFMGIARDQGTKHYLKKPFTAEVLTSRIASFGRAAAA